MLGFFFFLVEMDLLRASQGERMWKDGVQWGTSVKEALLQGQVLSIWYSLNFQDRMHKFCKNCGRDDVMFVPLACSTHVKIHLDEATYISFQYNANITSKRAEPQISGECTK